ncbi:hypothetical protein F7725_016196 [Dissostichus mawsoni]|uniref:Uncharacterized protein n=1 Tax=Dissostichus mawsoni TaxID=36200 RepID=A0A7J5Y726_DISMA|nr:hypothetical protein F7725_016196 [Dissostichus mawsoni]
MGGVILHKVFGLLRCDHIDNLSADSSSSGLKVVVMNWAWPASSTIILPVLGVEGLVDLIEQVEGSGVAFLDGKDQGQSHQRLLTSRQLLHLSHLTLLPCERHLQRAGEGGYERCSGSPSPSHRLPALTLVLRLAAFSVALLHHQRGFASGHQLQENLTEVLRHLRERKRGKKSSTVGLRQ